jgi:hypothetical protein
MGPLVCPETWVRSYQYALRNSSEERSFQMTTQLLSLPDLSQKSRDTFVRNFILESGISIRQKRRIDTALLSLFLSLQTLSNLRTSRNRICFIMWRNMKTVYFGDLTIATMTMTTTRALCALSITTTSTMTMTMTKGAVCITDNHDLHNSQVKSLTTYTTRKIRPTDIELHATQVLIALLLTYMILRHSKMKTAEGTTRISTWKGKPLHGRHARTPNIDKIVQ